MPTTDIMNLLKIDSVNFSLVWRQEFSRQAGGTPRVKDLGAPYWMAKLGCSNLQNTDFLQSGALINRLHGSIDTFYVWEPRAQFPQSDLTGSILGSSNVTIHTIGTGNDTIRITGLPVGYVITKGDKFCFDHGSNPVHRCFHEFSANAVAAAGGLIPLTAIVPNIRVGATVGLVVTLIKPSAEMFIAPGSFDAPSTGAMFSSISLTAIQVP